MDPNVQKSEDQERDTPSPPPKVSKAIEHREASLSWLETQKVNPIQYLLRNFRLR